MKCLMPSVFGTAVLASALLLNAHAETLPPGQVDFGTFSPPSGGGQFVEVNLTSSLISMAAHFLEKQEPDVAQLLNGLHQVHVNVIGLSDENRNELGKRAEKISKDLDAKGWEKIVTVQQEEQKVNVYLKTLNKDTVQGIVVMVMDGSKQAVFVNIVGDIKPDQLSLLGDRLNIDPLKKLHLGPKHTEKNERG